MSVVDSSSSRWNDQQSGSMTTITMTTPSTNTPDKRISSTLSSLAKANKRVFDKILDTKAARLMKFDSFVGISSHGYTSSDSNKRSAITAGRSGLLLTEDHLQSLLTPETAPFLSSRIGPTIPAQEYHLDDLDVRMNRMLHDAEFFEIHEATISTSRQQLQLPQLPRLSSGSLAQQRKKQTYQIKFLRRSLFATHSDQGGGALESAVTKMMVEALYLAHLSHPHIATLRGINAGGIAAMQQQQHDSPQPETFFILTDRWGETLAQRLESWKQWAAAKMERERKEEKRRLQRAKRRVSRVSSMRSGESLSSNPIFKNKQIQTYPEDLVVLKTNYALQILRALEYLHERRIVIRELTPDGIGFCDFPNHHHLQLVDLSSCREIPRGKTHIPPDADQQLLRNLSTMDNNTSTSMASISPISPTKHQKADEQLLRRHLSTMDNNTSTSMASISPISPTEHQEADEQLLRRHLSTMDNNTSTTMASISPISPTEHQEADEQLLRHHLSTMDHNTSMARILPISPTEHHEADEQLLRHVSTMDNNTSTTMASMANISPISPTEHQEVDEQLLLRHLSTMDNNTSTSMASISPISPSEHHEWAPLTTPPTKQPLQLHHDAEGIEVQPIVMANIVSIITATEECTYPPKQLQPSRAIGDEANNKPSDAIVKVQEATQKTFQPQNASPASRNLVEAHAEADTNEASMRLLEVADAVDSPALAAVSTSDDEEDSSEYEWKKPMDGTCRPAIETANQSFPGKQSESYRLHEQDLPAHKGEHKSVASTVVAASRHERLLGVSATVAARRYMAPELFRGIENDKSKGYNTQADLYSFAIIFTELLTEKKPYGTKHFSRDWEKIIDGTLRPNIKKYHFPRTLKGCLEQAWHAQPEKRGTAAQLCKSMERVLVMLEGGHQGTEATSKCDTKRGHQPAPPNPLDQPRRTSKEDQSQERTLPERAAKYKRLTVKQPQKWSNVWDPRLHFKTISIDDEVQAEIQVTKEDLFKRRIKENAIKLM